MMNEWFSEVSPTTDALFIDPLGGLTTAGLSTTPDRRLFTWLDRRDKNLWRKADPSTGNKILKIFFRKQRLNKCEHPPKKDLP